MCAFEGVSLILYNDFIPFSIENRCFMEINASSIVIRFNLIILIVRKRSAIVKRIILLWKIF